MTVLLNKENKILCTASLKYTYNVLCLVTQSCPTLRLLCPWGFCRQEYWSGLPRPPPDIYNKRIQKDQRSKEKHYAWISLQSKELSRVFSNTTVQSINFSGLSFLYSPTLTSIHDYWKNHSFNQTDLCWQSNVFASQYAFQVGHNFSSKE